MQSDYNEDELIEEKFHFISDDELQKDFMSGANISITNIPTKVYFYIYSIVSPEWSEEDYPFLKVYLRTDDNNTILGFPSVDISRYDVLGNGGEQSDLNEMFLGECMEKFTTEIIKEHEVAINYMKYYKGFIVHNEKIIIVFQLPQILTDVVEESGDLTVAVIDEIINKKSVNNVIIDENFRKFLYDNLNCLYIRKENFENFEIPQVFYGEENLVRSVSEYGFFYKLSPVPSETFTKKYVGFIEEKVFYAKKTELTSSDINKEFEASVIVDPEGKFWYFKCIHIFFAISTHYRVRYQKEDYNVV